MRVKTSLLVSCVIMAIVASYLAAWQVDDARLDPQRQQAQELADEGLEYTVKSLEIDSGLITVECAKKGRFFINEACPHFAKWKQLEKGSKFQLRFANHSDHLFGPPLLEQPDCFLVPDTPARKVAKR